MKLRTNRRGETLLKEASSPALKRGKKSGRDRIRRTKKRWLARRRDTSGTVSAHKMSKTQKGSRSRLEKIAATLWWQYMTAKEGLSSTTRGSPNVRNCPMKVGFICEQCRDVRERSLQNGSSATGSAVKTAPGGDRNRYAGGRDWGKGQAAEEMLTMSQNAPERYL